VELLNIRSADVTDRISYHNSITTTIEREGKNERVRFRRGDKIWILPDPQWLPPVSEEVAINELADDEWWVGEILDCCALDQDGQRPDSLGLLRVAVSRITPQILFLGNNNVSVLLDWTGS